MGWIRIEGPSISGDLFSHDSSSCPTSPCTNDRFGFSFQITNGDQLDLVVRDMSDRRWIVQTTVPRPEMIGQWTHVAATYNGSASPSGIAIYVNGDLASTTVIYNTGFTVLNGSTPLALRIGATQGSRGNIIQGIDGQIDHASFWRGALTASQIAADYASTAPMQTASEAIYALIGQVLALNLKKGITNSLDSKLSAAVNALDDANQHNDVAAVNALQAFINAVQAQIGGALSPGEAASLIASAQAIIERLA